MQADGDAHAAIQDSTKHVNMQVEPRLQPKKEENKTQTTKKKIYKKIVHLSLYSLSKLSCASWCEHHNQAEKEKESCSDSKLLYIHTEGVQIFRVTEES